jgi:transcriptional regulator with XRE-family HTH domain
MTIIDLAETFRQARIERRLTQREVATEAGLGSITVSRFERGALTEIGLVKLLAMFRVVGLELFARPVGHRRTLDDIPLELISPHNEAATGRPRQRVRHTSAQKKVGS